MGKTTGMKQRRYSLCLATWAVVTSATVGCAPLDRPGPPIAVAQADADGEISFDDLAVVLAAVVGADGRIDATALAAHLPRLDRQLAQLGGPWPAPAAGGQTDQRLAWLYNARAAWSLRIVARELRPLAGRADAFTLPRSIPRRRLLLTPLPLAGKWTTLAEIDDDLARYDDFRLAASAPGASDLAGRLPQRPFAAQTVRSLLATRFRHYVRDGSRLVADHDRRRLYVPPALWRVAPRLKAEFNRRFDTRDASLVTALGPYLDAQGRRRLAGALGYRVSRRTGPAGIVARRLSQTQRRRFFGP